MKTKIFATVFFLIAIPNVSFALATDLHFGSLIDLADTLASGVVTSLGYLAFTIAVVAFLWGMVNFIWAARNGDAGKGVENGKQFMLWGLIALFVMFSVWGIIIFTQSIFNIKGQTSIVIPNIELLGAKPSGRISTGPTATAECPNGTQSSCSKKDADGTLGIGKCDVNSKCSLKDLPCMATVSSVNGKPSLNDATGHYDDTDHCIVTGANSGSASAGVTTVCPNGPRSVCSIKDLANGGKIVTGVCSDTGSCDITLSNVSNNTTTGPDCKLTIGMYAYSGNYNTSVPPKCIPNEDISTGCSISGGTYNPVDKTCSGLTP